MSTDDKKQDAAKANDPPIHELRGKTRKTQAIDPKPASTWTMAGDNKYHATGTKSAIESITARVFHNGTLISTGQNEAVVDPGMDWRVHFPNVTANMTVNLSIQFDDGEDVAVEPINTVQTN